MCCCTKRVLLHRSSDQRTALNRKHGSAGGPACGSGNQCRPRHSYLPIKQNDLSILFLQIISLYYKGGYFPVVQYCGPLCPGALLFLVFFKRHYFQAQPCLFQGTATHTYTKHCSPEHQPQLISFLSRKHHCRNSYSFHSCSWHKVILYECSPGEIKSYCSMSDIKMHHTGTLICILIMSVLYRNLGKLS